MAGGKAAGCRPCNNHLTHIVMHGRERASIHCTSRVIFHAVLGFKQIQGPQHGFHVAWPWR